MKIDRDEIALRFAVALAPLVYQRGASETLGNADEVVVEALGFADAFIAHANGSEVGALVQAAKNALWALRRGNGTAKEASVELEVLRAAAEAVEGGGS